MAVSGFDLLGGGIIKSVQHISASMTSNEVNIDISPVNAAKTVVKISSYSSSDQMSALLVRGHLESNNLLKLTRGSSDSITTTVQVEVIEFDESCYVYSTRMAIGASSGNAWLGREVDPSKTLLFLSTSTSDTSTTARLSRFTTHFTNNNTTVRITRGVGSETAATVQLYVVDLP